MNGRERVALAMQHKTPDHVPVMCQLSLGHYFLNMRGRWKPHEIFFSSEAFSDSLVSMCRRYRFDGILINIPGRDPAWRDAIKSVEEGNDGELLTWQDGTHTFVPWDDSPLFEPSDPYVAPRPDFESFDPDRNMDLLDDWPRYTWGVYHIPRVAGKAPGLLLEPPDTFFRTIDLVKAAVGDSLSVHGEVFSPFTHYMELFGYEGALLGLVVDPGKAEAILERFVDTTTAWGQAQARRGSTRC